jgi:hypothetical protein
MKPNPTIPARMIRPIMRKKTGPVVLRIRMEPVKFPTTIENCMMAKKYPK